MEEIKFSIYDVILKGINTWQGKSFSHLWKTFSQEQKQFISNCFCGFHYVPAEELDDNWHVDAAGNAFANFKSTSTMKPYEDYSGYENNFSEKLFSVKWWVYSLWHFNLRYEYRGFTRKEDALAYYKKQRGNPDYFTVVLFRMREYDCTDFIPIDYRYPIQEIIDKKYRNSVRRNAGSGFPKQSFDNFLCQYLHNLIHSNYVRAHEDDRDFWWNLGIDFNEAEHMIKVEKQNYRFHLFELADKAFDYIHDGAPIDMSTIK